MIRLAAATALALVAALAPASAQPRSIERGAFDALGPGTRSFPTNTPLPGPRGQVCVAWCPSDLNPCDPPEYKRTDARCSRGAR